MTDKPKFKITEKMFKTLTDWQEKIDSGEVKIPEKGTDGAKPPQNEKPKQES